MNQELWIFDKYKEQGIVLGSEVLLRQSGALDFIQDCWEKRLIIVGIEFFRQEQEKEKVIPVSIADFSSLGALPDAIERSTAEAKMIVEKGLPDQADLALFTVKNAPS